MKPTGEVLIALAKALDVKPDYFLREPVQLGPVEFRKSSALSAKQIDSIKEKVKDHLERYLEVEQLLDIKSKFSNPVKNIQIAEVEQVEKAALKLIKDWNLGYDPIPNVIEMLENNEVRVIEMDAPDAFDGLSTFVGDIPVVVINKNYSVERKRFTALHELGHLVLNIEKGADKERICHAFAGALLLPDDCLEKLIGATRNNIAMGELVSIKEQFGISVQAIMMRAQLKGEANPRDVKAALSAYEAHRKPILDKLVKAANASAEWYENFGTHMALPPYDFAMSYLSRTGRMDIERIRKVAPKFVAEWEKRKGSV